MDELLTKRRAFKGGVLRRIDVVARWRILKTTTTFVQGDQACTKLKVVELKG